MAHHIRRLYAVDRFLNFRVKFLHAETGAGEAQLYDTLDHFIGKGARVTFDGQFGVGGDVEIGPHGLHRALQIIRHQRRRCPPPPQCR
jgi:hypothetical protein